MTRKGLGGKACYNIIYGFCIFGYIFYRFCKGTLRFSVIYGALIGDKLKEYNRKIKPAVHDLILQGRNLLDQMPFVILAIIYILPLLMAAEDTYCSNGMLLSSEFGNCHRTGDISGINYQITRKGQVTLGNLEHSTCL